MHRPDGERADLLVRLGDAQLRAGCSRVLAIAAGAERRTAVLSEGSERDRLFCAMAGKKPNFAENQKATTRIIPVVVLERV